MREVITIDRRSARQATSDLLGHAWRAIAVAVVVALLTFGGWSLKDSAIDIATVLPSSVPAQIE
jgi:hypothetical protein